MGGWDPGIERKKTVGRDGREVRRESQGTPVGKPGRCGQRKSSWTLVTDRTGQEGTERLEPVGIQRGRLWGQPGEWNC